ncbi:hypothetical protein EDC01DRAFT_641230 [Geopyxis carbonaria]|nr:hypothetical protein EDC01DRAFT_641230 [Geopyxis carbonaria]
MRSGGGSQRSGRQRGVLCIFIVYCLCRGLCTDKKSGSEDENSRVLCGVDRAESVWEMSMYPSIDPSRYMLCVCASSFSYIDSHSRQKKKEKKKQTHLENER